MASARIRFDEAADLPAVCVCCGAPATRTRQQEFPVNASMSAAVLVMAAMVDALVWTKRSVTLALPVCDYHKRRGRQANRTFFRGMGLTVAIGVAAYIASLFDGSVGNYLGVLAAFTFMATLVAGMHEVDDGLSVKSIQDDSFTLRGVSRKFAEAMQQGEESRRVPGGR